MAWGPAMADGTAGVPALSRAEGHPAVSVAEDSGSFSFL